MISDSQIRFLGGRNDFYCRKEEQKEDIWISVSLYFPLDDKIEWEGFQRSVHSESGMPTRGYGSAAVAAATV